MHLVCTTICTQLCIYCQCMYSYKWVKLVLLVYCSYYILHKVEYVC